MHELITTGGICMKARPSGNGMRSDCNSGNKITNQTPFKPAYSEVDKWVEKYKLWTSSEKTLLVDHQPVPGMVHPLSLEDVQKVIQQLPEEFTQGIRAIILCQGSKKQQRVRKECIFGCYSVFYQSIFLFPFLESFKLYYGKRPKPSLALEFERHGALWNEKTGTFDFTIEALQSFYMWDVLIHEVGHYVSHRVYGRNLDYSSEERFAEWFSIEYGLRKKK